jgi:hypothetical protein
MVERKYRPLRRSEPFSFRAERMPALAAESCISPLSPVRYGWKQRRLSRGISAFSRLERKPTDCVADDAVCCELLSRSVNRLTLERRLTIAVDRERAG